MLRRFAVSGECALLRFGGPILVLCAILICEAGGGSVPVASAPLLSTGAKQADETDFDDLMMTCGPRCLFVWLRLQGLDVRYDDVARIVPVNSKGTSILDLVDTSQNWPCRLKAIRISPRELEGVTLPAIAHIWLDDRQASRGHYVVIVKVLPEEIVFADVTTSAIENVTRERFQDAWSGYLLIRDDDLKTVIVQVFFLLATSSILLLLIGFAMIYHRRVTPVEASAVTLLFTWIALSGCQQESSPTVPKAESDMAHPISSRPLDDRMKVFPLKTSATTKDLGTVMLGDEAMAIFTLANVSDRVLTLKLGRPTCSCLTASLDTEVLSPRDSTELKLVLDGRAFAGRREGSIAVGAGDLGSAIFTTRGLIEGMTTFPYSIKIPEDISTFEAPPIVGEIVLGPERTTSHVQFLEVLILDEGEHCIRLGDPVISRKDVTKMFVRIRFQIPVYFDKNLRPLTKSYPVRITFRVDDTTVDYPLALNVFPLAPFPGSQQTRTHENQ